MRKQDSKLNVTRRTFLQGSAALAATATVSTVALGAWEKEVLAHEKLHGEKATKPSTCNACSSKCGLVANTVGGVLHTLNGHPLHPYSQGQLCARGHGFAQQAYNPDLLTQPMKRNAEGQYEVITWETAFAEIGEKLLAIKEESGAGSIAVVQNPRHSGKYYSDRFIKALGSNNIHTHNSACNTSKTSGINLAIGKTDFSVDMAHSKMVVFIGRSYGDGIRPAHVASVAKAADNGARIVIVDPRLNNTGIFATDWVPIIPGQDLALLMGICHVLIEEDLYDKDFIAEHTEGFSEFAEQAKQYTPEWTESVCDVPADKIVELARALAEAAPAAAVESGWRAAYGCAYQNSLETARAITAVNALLGAWGAKGGALLGNSVKPGKLEDARFDAPPKPSIPRITDKKYPLTTSAGSANGCLEAATAGDVKAMLFYTCNIAKGYTQPKYAIEAIRGLGLSVCIDIHMSETAMQCDYVLPECTYLERAEVPEFVSGKKQFAVIRSQAIDKVHPDTLPCDQIFKGLAETCGIGEYFNFTVEEFSRAQLATLGIDYDEILEKGVMEITQKAFEYKVPKFGTPSGKFEFVSQAVGDAGLNPVIGYREVLVTPKENELHLIGGKQAIHSHTMTLNIEALNEISHEYDLERVWISAKDAKDRGIEDYDMITMASSEYSGQVRARVTQRLKPGVVFMPTHYGCSSPYQTRAFEYGLPMMDFVPYAGCEPGVGAAMTQEVAVTIEKAEV